ncbi:phospholipase D/Transphosphatidylase [Rhodopirellula maiorica SM1]|uniref:Phospholipase D/Transphosphatidylase n=2 Tax=Novipirellula TaxID=2795426 RepID=M5S582_9BACT|nr:phospholipase D/Transphosphatidylase [Rhodopirellula maiorica SM1]
MVYVGWYVGSVIGALLMLVAMTAMRHDERKHVGRFGWIVVILVCPPVGFLLYLIFAGRKISAEHELRGIVKMPPCPSVEVHDQCGLSNIGIRRGLASATPGNCVKLLAKPEEMYQHLFELIDSATESLYVLSFIMADDDLGHKIMDKLAAKARAGVDVKLLVDGVGAFLMPDEMLDTVRDAGGEAMTFKPVSRLSRFAYLNFRNHRKLVIADGKRAFVGGANLVQYEITDQPDEDTWVDLCVAITGPAACQVEAVFRSDWRFVNRDHSLDEADLQKEIPCCGVFQPKSCDSKQTESSDGNTEPCERIDGKSGDCDSQKDGSEHQGGSTANAEHDGASRVQVIPIGADGPGEVMEDLLITAIQRATKRVWIVTPYFIPSSIAMRSLEMACRREIDVRIMFPNVSDMMPADYARFEYSRDLHEAGARVLRYRDGVVHTKAVLVDDEVAFIGSANFDMRSFFLNYEMMLAIHDPRVLHELGDWYTAMEAQCDDRQEPDSLRRRFFSTAARIFGSEL